MRINFNEFFAPILFAFGVILVAWLLLKYWVKKPKVKIKEFEDFEDITRDTKVIHFNNKSNNKNISL